MFFIETIKRSIKAKYIGSIVRSLLLFLGGFLVARGYINQDELESITTHLVNAVVQAAPAIIAAVWSLFEKKKRVE